MKIEEIEKHLKVGCKIKFSTDGCIETVRHLDAESIWIEGMDRRCNWSHIYEIVSWPIPSGFKQEHEGHWIKLSDPENTIIGYLEPYLGKWYEIKKICVNGNPEIYVCGSGHNVSRTYIGDYRPIPPVEEITPIS
jgi:hypothetical protein